MTAFKRFEPEDQLDNVIILEPRYDLASGSNGWRGSPEGGSSLNLYGGVGRSGIVNSWRYDPVAPVDALFGQHVRTKLTASVKSIWMTDEQLPAGQVTDTRWGEEHWDVVQGLYSYYSDLDPDFVTSSYDYYSVYFNKDSRNIVAFARGDVGISGAPSGSWTIESWIKPFQTASLTNDFTIVSMNGWVWFGITGSSGLLVVSSSHATATSSFGPPVNRWSHVAATFDSVTASGTFAIDGVAAGSYSLASALVPGNSLTASITFGNVYGGAIVIHQERPFDDGGSGSLRRSFHGLMGETRFWNYQRSAAQLSASMRSQISESDYSGTLAAAKFTEGPLALFSYGNELFNAPRNGSGTADLTMLDRLSAYQAVVGSPYGWLGSFEDRPGPMWHPNDNVSFYPAKSLAGPPFSGNLEQLFIDDGSGFQHYFGIERVRRLSVIDIPSAFYGRRIVPGSVSMTCRAFSSSSHGLVRTLVDDSRGNLFISSSVSSGTDESYRGVEWNKVGNVFYSEGIIVIKDPALLDFGRTDGASAHLNDTLQLSFSGDSRVPVKTLMCRMDRGEFNCTSNSTFYTLDDEARVKRHPSGSTWVSSVGVYDADRRLVGVAKLAQPIRKRPQDRITVKIRCDF